MNKKLGWLLIVLLGCVGCQRSNDALFVEAIEGVASGKAKSIDIRNAPIADESSLSKLAGLSNLDSLNLDKSPVTDAGLASIGPQPALRALSLTRTAITNKSLATIAENFPGLVYLRLDETTINDNALESLSGLKQLQEISLFRVPVGDRACKVMAEIASLRRISLDQSMITDAGLDALATRDDLERVSIWQCPISDEAVAKFKKACPKTILNR